jgi:hypothetical protein
VAWRDVGQKRQADRSLGRIKLDRVVLGGEVDRFLGLFNFGGYVWQVAHSLDEGFLGAISQILVITNRSFIDCPGNVQVGMP